MGTASVEWCSSAYDLQFCMLSLLPYDDDTQHELRSCVANGVWCLLWRLLRVGVPASRNVHAYDCCPEQYIDVTFKIHIRRRMLYYLLNLVLPCFFLSGLSLMVFIMPPDSGEKVTCGTFIPPPPPQPEPTICDAWLRIEWQHPAVSRLQCFTCVCVCVKHNHSVCIFNQ